MDDLPIGNIIRLVRCVTPEDPIGRAAESIRAGGLTEAPVVESGRLLGLITERDILAALDAEPDSATNRTVRDFISEGAIFASPFMTVTQVAGLMNQHELQTMPVVDGFGGYLGMVVRSDVVGALCLTSRPPMIGGLATPLGVFLTTGNLRAGASDLGLLLTGVALGLMFYAASALVLGLAWLMQRLTHLPLIDILNSASVGVPNSLDALKVLMLAAPVLVFLWMLRTGPLAGYHAAEHQVVNAIENGEPLKPEYVSLMSRVHPRCGTNLMASVSLFMMISERFSSQVAVLITVFVIIFAWKTIGGYLQYYVTTRTPSEKQLRSGIRAGEELLGKYRKNPAYRVTGWQRVWNTGMPQVMIGMLITTSLGEMMHGLFPILF